MQKHRVLFLVLILSVVAVGLVVYSNYLLRNNVGSMVDAGSNGQKSLPLKNLIKSIKTPVQQIGNKDATVTIVVFEDYQCPYCKKFNTDILPKIKKDYIDTGKVLFIHQDLAFLGPESISSAEAVHCAGDQGKFWEYREYLYHNQGVRNSGSFSDENLNKFAKNLGLNMSDFNTCSESGKYRDDVIEARNFAKSYGITVTPTFVINGEVVIGVQPIDIFEGIINKILKD